MSKIANSIFLSFFPLLFSSIFTFRSSFLHFIPSLSWNYFQLFQPFASSNFSLDMFLLSPFSWLLSIFIFLKWCFLVRGPWPVGKKNSNRPIQSTQKYHLIWTPAVKAQGQYFFYFSFSFPFFYLILSIYTKYSKLHFFIVKIDYYIIPSTYQVMS
jgi:hypothetical protein